MIRALLLSLLLLVSGCSSLFSGGSPVARRSVEIENQRLYPVVVYVSYAGSERYRVTRMQPNRTRTVGVPENLFLQGMTFKVCLAGNVECTHTDQPKVDARDNKIIVYATSLELTAQAW